MPTDRDTPTERAMRANMGTPNKTKMPSIRFVPHQDPGSARPSLQFDPISRNLRSMTDVIRVGRYSEKDGQSYAHTDASSAGPVGFKSKVVSRRHCEFWFQNGQWYIKDVKSSSGTFLNRLRLSQASTESRPYQVNDGDIVQLGIDFKGGEEMIFRCVKMRVECNRDWQKTVNPFNIRTIRRLQNLRVGNAQEDTDADSAQTPDCSICLFPIAPCQSLFVAPCSHVWHYKCIRPILNSGALWGRFQCPNCRAVADLDAEIEDVSMSYGENQAEGNRNGVNGTAPEGAENTDQPSGSTNPSHEAAGTSGSNAAPQIVNGNTSTANNDLQALEDRAAAYRQHFARYRQSLQAAIIDGANGVGNSAATPNTSAIPVPAGQPQATTSTEHLAAEGPMTPRNDIGPFVLEGSPRDTTTSNGSRFLASLDAATSPGSESEINPFGYIYSEQELEPEQDL